MKHITLVLIAAAVLGGCMSNSSNVAREPNYVQAQIYQNPVPVGNSLGSNSMSPAVGGPR